MVSRSERSVVRYQGRGMCIRPDARRRRASEHVRRHLMLGILCAKRCRIKKKKEAATLQMVIGDTSL
jgi:hypothetical protein